MLYEPNYRLAINLVSAVILLSMIACESPFNISVTPGEETLFQPKAELEGFPNTGLAYVVLSWVTPAVDDFKLLDIEYRNYKPDSVKPEEWTVATTIRSAGTRQYRHAVYDDEDLEYRFAMLTINGATGYSELIVYLPRTTRLSVPPETNTLGDYYDSPLMDPGDSLILETGDHIISQLDATEKLISFIGAGRADEVRVSYPPELELPSERDPESFLLKVKNSNIANITFKDARSDVSGGALIAEGRTRIINCIFRDNASLKAGGALMLNHGSTVSNCIFINNSAVGPGGSIYASGNAYGIFITNCTIVNSISYGNGGDAIATGFVSADIHIRNCIIYNSGNMDITTGSGNPLILHMEYSLADPIWTEVDDTNISGIPEFLNLSRDDYHLATGSIGIDQGDPNPAYRDIDGTRNDMGAYGGPLGGW